MFAVKLRFAGKKKLTDTADDRRLQQRRYKSRKEEI